MRPSTASSESKNRSAWRRNGSRTATVSAAMRRRERSLTRRLDKRMKNADAELTRVLVIGHVQERWDVRLVHRDAQFRHLTRAELRGLERNLPEQLLPFVQSELIHDLAAERHLHLLRFAENVSGVIDVEIERAVLFRVLEGQRRDLFGPLPFDRRVVR